jgi:hypothetical protein
MLDECFGIMRVTEPVAQPNYKGGYIGVVLGNTVDNYLLFAPRKTELRVWTHRLKDNVEWKRRLEEADINVVQQREDKIAFTLTPSKLKERRPILAELFKEAHDGRWSAPK